MYSESNGNGEQLPGVNGVDGVNGVVGVLGCVGSIDGVGGLCGERGLDGWLAADCARLGGELKADDTVAPIMGTEDSEALFLCPLPPTAPCGLRSGVVVPLTRSATRRLMPVDLSLLTQRELEILVPCPLLLDWCDVLRSLHCTTVCSSELTGVLCQLHL